MQGSGNGIDWKIGIRKKREGMRSWIEKENNRGSRSAGEQDRMEGLRG